MCLYMNMKEVDVAEAMGVSSTNPVAMYATAGLKRLIGLVQMGQFPRFKDSYGTAASLGIPDLSIYDPSRPVRQRILSRKQMLRSHHRYRYEGERPGFSDSRDPAVRSFGLRQH